MLPFKNRLTKKKDFERVQRGGTFFSDGNIAVKISKNDLRETRVGIIVGVKFSKKATERNQAKRWLREIFQREMRRLRKGADIAVMVRRRDKEPLRLREVTKNVVRVLEKSRLFEPGEARTRE